MVLVPWQSLKEEIELLAKKVRVNEAAAKREAYVQLKEVDSVGFKNAMKTRTAKEEKIVCHSASLAGWTGAKLCEAGMQGDCKCQICGEEESSPGHFQWHCKEIAARRKQTYVCAINPDDLPAHLQMGLPGMMEKGLHQTFWGKQRDEVKTEDPEARKKMGIPVGKSAIAISESRNLEAEALFREKGWKARN